MNNTNAKNVYAAMANNIDIRKSSSSGGIFSLLAEKILFDDGVVYGVALSDDCMIAEYKRVACINDLVMLRGSKYFQAKVGDILKQVKDDLQAGKNVLFTGTGCQINGLKYFLGQEFDNLITVDVVCHGVPSPKLWREYAHYQETKHGKLESVSFRCKDDSWKKFGIKKNQLYISKDKDVFMQMFLRDYCLRPSCFKCHAKNFKKSDITIADFWGIEKVAPEMNDGQGTSLVIIRTDKGQELFDSVMQGVKYKEISYKDGVRDNPAEYRSVNRPLQRDTFFEDMNKLPFKKLSNKYIYGPLWKRVDRKIRQTVKQIFANKAVRPRSNVDYGLLFIFKK